MFLELKQSLFANVIAVFEKVAATQSKESWSSKLFFQQNRVKEAPGKNLDAGFGISTLENPYSPLLCADSCGILALYLIIVLSCT